MMRQKIEPQFENLHILVIEDNRGDFVLIEDFLIEEFKTIEVAHCRDFTSSISYLEQNKQRISAVLLDLSLPDKQGLQLINELMSYNFQIPFIILTGYSDLRMTKQSLQLGISDYLIKDELNPVVLHKTISFAINRNSFINHIENEKQNYENLFNFSPQPTWLLDTETFQILNANIAAQKKYGYSLRKFRTMFFTQLHPEEEVTIVKQKLASTNDELSRYHFTHFLEDQREIKVELYFKEISNTSASRLIVQSNDITKTLKRINTIEIQNARLKEIAWTQSHVVRAPLCRIMGIINLIEDESENLENRQFWLDQLRISTNEMDDIVKNIVNKTINFEKE